MYRQKFDSCVPLNHILMDNDALQTLSTFLSTDMHFDTQRRHVVNRDSDKISITLDVVQVF